MPASRRLLRWARAKLAHLPAVPDPWNIHEYTRSVAEWRQRPIELVARTMSRYASVATGLWIQRADRDQIVYDDTGTELHRDHIILHELAHMLCGHEGISLDATGSTRSRSALSSSDTDAPGAAAARTRLAAELRTPEESGSGGATVRTMHRSAYDDNQEMQAEMLAYAIWQAAGLRLVPGAGAITRLAGAFEHH